MSHINATPMIVLRICRSRASAWTPSSKALISLRSTMERLRGWLSSQYIYDAAPSLGFPCKMVVVCTIDLHYILDRCKIRHVDVEEIQTETNCNVIHILMSPTPIQTRLTLCSNMFDPSFEMRLWSSGCLPTPP